MLNAIYPIIGTQTALPFYLTGVGVCDPECSVKRENGLISHQFLFTAEGTGMLKVGEASYIQKRGSIFYLAPGVPHEYYPQESNWVTNWLVFNGSYADKLMRNLGFSEFEYSAETDTAEYEKIFRRIITAAGEPVKGGETASVHLYEFIIAARGEMFSTAKEKASSGSVVDPAIIYINKNYVKSITLNYLSEMSGVSLQHFCRVFKAKTGMRPMEYVARKRITEAKILLINTDKSVAEIGLSVGYEDRNYFGMVFKKYEGVSPSEYRRQRGKGII